MHIDNDGNYIYSDDEVERMNAMDEEASEAAISWLASDGDLEGRIKVINKMFDAISLMNNGSFEFIVAASAVIGANHHELTEKQARFIEEVIENHVLRDTVLCLSDD